MIKLLKINTIINKTGMKTRGFMVLAGLFQGWMDEIKAQKTRLFLWVPVAFGMGIALYFILPFEPSLWAGLLPLVVLGAALIKLYHRHHDNLFWFLSYLVCFAAVLGILGFCAAMVGTLRVGTPILEKALKFADVEGHITSIEKLDGKRGSRVVMDNLVIEDLERQKTPKKIRITFRKDEGLKAGSRIKTLAKLDPPSSAVLPGAYDFRRHLFFDGIGAVGFSYRAPEILSQSDDGIFFENLRHSISKTISEHAGSVSAGIMAALITGARGEIAEEDNEAMRDSGLYHLLSISGSHVAMVAGVLFFFSRFFMATIPWLALHAPIKKIAAVLALLGATFYVFLAGAEVPAQRALLMTALVMVAIMFDRSPFSMRLIAFSALVVLTIAPFALVGVSFQMSFAAVAALICFFEYIRPWWTAWYSRGGYARKAFMYLCAVLITSLIAGGMTGLFSLYHFQSFAVYGVISNMMAVPLTAFIIMPAAVVAVLFMPFGLSSWPLQIMEWGVLKMLIIAHWAGSMEGAVIHVHQWPVLTLGFITVGIVLFLLWSGWRGKGFAVLIVLIGLLVAGFHKMPDVMVSGTGKLVGVYEDGVLYVSSTRREKFISENWSRLLGHEDVKPKSFYSDDAPMTCDDYACRWEYEEQRMSFVKGREAMEEECAWANVMIAEIPVPRGLCGDDVKVFDLYDFKDGGAHAFYVDADGVRVESVGEGVGKRPWR